MKGGCCD